MILMISLIAYWIALDKIGIYLKCKSNWVKRVQSLQKKY